MTRKHFKLLADQINKHFGPVAFDERIGKAEAVVMVLPVLCEFESFNEEKFFDACGVTREQVLGDRW